MSRKTAIVLLATGVLVDVCAAQTEREQVGPVKGGYLVPTSQLIRPAGRTLEFAGRPVALALAPDGKYLFAKDNRGLVVIDTQRWQLAQELGFKRTGGSLCGLALTRDGLRLFATAANGQIIEAAVGDDGRLEVHAAHTLPGPGGKGNSFPCGIVLTPDERRAWVCLSRNNSLALVEVDGGKVLTEIPVGIAPYAVALSPDGRLACVSNWGGRRPSAGQRTAKSAGSETLVDERGVAASGTVSIVDLEARKVLGEIEVGLSPCDVVFHPTAPLAYVAAANSDEVACVDVSSRRVIDELVVRPDPQLPFGSMPNGLALAPDGQTLYVSLAGNNAVAVVPLRPDGHFTGDIAGFIPTAWYPGAVLLRDGKLFVACIKGVGSRTKRRGKRGFNSHWHRGTVSVVDLPDESTLARYTRQVLADGRVPQILRARQRSVADVRPVPVPERPGEPSVFEHVVFILKENRTYDQVFGDLPQGNGDPALCVFGREVTPNHHALAEEFVLLDNYYCNGVLSADGHSWATEGNVTPYLERAFGGFGRSYTFGNDPLTYSSSGFIWDHVLAAGLSFRNYGEFDATRTRPRADYLTIYLDFLTGAGRIKRIQHIGVEKLRRYTAPDSVGWNMNIPDVLRAAVFINDLRRYEQEGWLPNFIFIYLPNDHTSGTRPGVPTPRALVADNDLALGRIVEALSHSVFWPRTVIFVNEDDPQNGYDHVDGHRSLCLVVSPYTRRGVVVSDFYNQTSVFHTIERILGVTAYNQLYALAPLMSNCFTERADLTPYVCRPNRVPLGELNRPRAMLTPVEQRLADASTALPLEYPDRADEDTLNRIIWHSVKGPETPYPAHYAGAHGRGLARLGLRLARPGEWSGVELVPEMDDDEDND